VLALLAANAMAVDPNHPVFVAERAAVKALVPDSAVTHTAVADGAWQDAATWDNGVPGDGAKVLIPMERSVSLAGETHRIKWLHVTGSLAMEPAVTSKLIVDTAVIGFCDGGGACGSFTSKPAAGVTHTVLFADMGPIDLAADPGQFGRGLICHGRFDVEGAAVAPWDEAVLDPPESMLTRNVVFTSESSVIGRRGHVMLMHTTDVNLKFARFTKLGRTNKGVAISTTNLRGRYGLHFHRCSLDTEINVEGLVVDDSPGWGLVNHSSNVNATDCIAYQALGSQFVGEAGNELGSFVHCLAARGKDGTIAGTAGRLNAQDFAFKGFGFFTQGTRIKIENCTAIGQRDFAFWPEALGLIETGLGECMVETKYLPDYLDWTGNVIKTTMRVKEIPFASIADNTAIDCFGGFGSQKANEDGPEVRRSFVTGLKVFGTKKDGIDARQSVAVTFRDFDVRGGTGAENGFTSAVPYGKDTHLLDFKLSDFPTGISVPQKGTTIIDGGIFSGNGVDIDLIRRQTVTADGRTVKITNCGSYTYKMGEAMLPIVPQQTTGNSYFQWEQTLLEGVQLYYKEQAADYVPFPANTPYAAVIPTEYFGKTNQQLMDEYGACLLAVIAPADAVPDVTGDGLLGSLATKPEDLAIISSNMAPVGTYTLKYQRWPGTPQQKTFTDPVPKTLHAGWNPVTTVVDGKKRTFLVKGQ
jgi:hypothetical protein